MNKVEVHTRNVPAAPDTETIDALDLTEVIRRRAFELFEERGGALGELDDWLTAEREICGITEELVENDQAFEVTLGVPGFTRDNIEVSANRDEIQIRAETHEDRDGQSTSREIYRHYDLPKAISEMNVTANLDGRVLKVRAPKLAAFAAKPLPVIAAVA